MCAITSGGILPSDAILTIVVKLISERLCTEKALCLYKEKVFFSQLAHEVGAMHNCVQCSRLFGSEHL